MILKEEYCLASTKTMSIHMLSKRKDIIEVVLTTDIRIEDLLNSGCDSTNGFRFESLVEILIVCKCIPSLHYTKIKKGVYTYGHEVINCRDIFNKSITDKSGGCSDITFEHNGILFPVSCKFYAVFDSNNYDVVIIKDQSGSLTYSTCLFVKDKNIVLKHKHINSRTSHKIELDRIIKNKLLFDLEDVKTGLEIFRRTFRNLNMDDFYEIVNRDYLMSPRKQLVLKLHQKMTYLKFIQNIEEKIHNISHKPRSGKSILILYIIKHLLETRGDRKILLLTSIPDTLESFYSDLDMYIDFKNIECKKQSDFLSIDSSFTGIISCSVEYLKRHTNNDKKNKLRELGIDTVIIDECHLGASNDRTEKDILDIINITSKNTIFASGTSEKTQSFFRLKSSTIYEWDIMDEQMMKNITEQTSIDYMRNRHCDIFVECLVDNTLNKDYSNCPFQVLIQPEINPQCIAELDRYNMENNTTFGWSSSSLFELKRNTDNKKKIKYLLEFELCKTVAGKNILISFLESMFSHDKNRIDTIERFIEETQFKYNSSRSEIQNPLMILLFLPINTRNNTISTLQETLLIFLGENNLWSEYHIVFSNSMEDSGDVSETYNNFIKTCMTQTIENGKKGCILLLGNKGSTGITYKDCDVTISLDDSHSLTNQKQRTSRALTSADGKTIGITVDMNLQRTYLTLSEMLRNYRKHTRTTMSDTEILTYMYTNNIFIFNPQKFNFGKCKKSVITHYYNKEIDDMKEYLNEEKLLESIKCDDDLREYIHTDLQNQRVIEGSVNPDLEGVQQELQKPSKDRTEIDNEGESDGEEKENKEDEEREIEIILINRTYELCKSFLFPLITLLGKTENLFDFNDVIETCKDVIIKIFEDKKIEINLKNYYIFRKIMKTIIENNLEIVDSIREIYRADSITVRKMIEKHFIPSNEEKKDNAEIPTPVVLVEEMLDKIPVDYWSSTTNKTFEPCCGKGNFVLGVVDRMLKGLEQIIEDRKDICMIVMRNLYYADITTLNVFITTELLKCHLEKYCNGEVLEFSFNKYIGNTLELDIKTIWNIEGFDLVVGNPPYNDKSGNKGKGHTLWTVFIDRSLDIWLVENGYLCFVNPSLWRQINHPLFLKMKEKQIVSLSIHNVKDGLKMFRCSTRYDFYLLQNKPVFSSTIIRCEDNVVVNEDIREWLFIPNKMFQEIKDLMNGEQKLTLIHSESKYEIRRKWMSKTKTDEFKYPVIYTINKENVISKIWSNRNDNGHFGVCKFIFSNGAGFYCDFLGEYGLSQWSYSIEDTKENLPKIERTFRSKRFNDIKDAIQLDSSSYNIKIMKLFRKDFYNDFLTDETTANTEQVITTENKTQPIKVLHDLKISELKNIARTEGIKGYSKYTTETKNELIEKIEKFRTQQIEPKTQPIKVLGNLKITELKNIARTEGIKGYSKYTTETKNELIEKIEKFRIDKL